ncbi:hypothetical protein [Marinicrinis lubricantis]|uniref:Uncharacterized protein n=1 Tax=Marinicrinis lubricantis TaxID=2086470 RepID=A0ABW1IRL6_9BACL
MKMARVGVLLDQTAVKRRHRYGMNVFEAYVEEVLSHAGIPFQKLHAASSIQTEAPDVLIAAFTEEDQYTADIIWEYAEKGGIVISYGGLNCLAVRLGFYPQPDIAIGYADMEGTVLSAEQPLRFLQAKPWKQIAESDHQISVSGMLRKEHPTGEEAGAVLLQCAAGEGWIDRFAVNIPHTIVMFQQGTGPVFHDGIPALDGSGSIDDNILKADDRCAMDWQWDRLSTETGAAFFAYPYADLWREQLISHLLKRVLEQGMTLPFIGIWPDGIPGVATISHDSDLNIDESAETTLSVLRECGIRSTWCMIEPGYSSYIYDQVKKEQHELAFHYNALDAQDGKWDDAEFDRQFAWMKQATGLSKVTSNKNHYTRFEGWGELFEWCEKNGIEAEQTRGPSKKGNIGFLFGTCHPYFPIAWSDQNNRLYNVLEISFLTQDLDHHSLSDSSVISSFLESVLRVEGAAHFLFHQVHIHEQPLVRKAIRKVVEEAKRRGMTFWTSKQINDWERARRKVRIDGMDSNGLVIRGEVEFGGMEVWIPTAAASSADGAEVEIKYGVPCVKKVLDQTAQREFM